MEAYHVHQPILLTEALDGLAIQPNGIYLDATFGRGGHSRAILSRLGPQGRLLALDQDPAAVQFARQQLRDDRVVIMQGSFAELEAHTKTWGVRGQVDGILFDLGVSSPQLDDPSRGFSFTRNGPLDMRMNPSQGPTAAQWLSHAREREIVQVIKTYGEERYARRIARAIVTARQQRPIETTAELAALVAAQVPHWERHRHPATRTFQALRIFINQELDVLALGLKQVLTVLEREGRLVVISFHSLEDRLVKRFIRTHSTPAQAPRGLPVHEAAPPCLQPVGKPIRPSPEEVRQNPRARSAILRIAKWRC